MSESTNIPNGFKTVETTKIAKKFALSCEKGHSSCCISTSRIGELILTVFPHLSSQQSCSLHGHWCWVADLWHLWIIPEISPDPDDISTYCVTKTPFVAATRQAPNNQLKRCNVPDRCVSTTVQKFEPSVGFRLVSCDLKLHRNRQVCFPRSPKLWKYRRFTYTYRPITKSCKTSTARWCERLLIDLDQTSKKLDVMCMVGTTSPLCM